MTLKPLTLENMETVRKWRHEYRETLRTPYMLTEEMQADYYKNVICNRDSNTRYWGLWEMSARHVDTLIGYGGLENISWENGNAEISLLIGPEYQKQGYGRIAVGMFLYEAFFRMRLHSVHGECYSCGPAEFWMRLIQEQEHGTLLPDRKFWNGQYYDSFYFTFYESDYKRLIEARQ